MQDMSSRRVSSETAQSAAAANRHHIVVVGGGAGGLELATRLGDKFGKTGKARITLIDRSRTHVWKPLLHEVAAGSLDVSRSALDYLAQGHRHGFQFRYGEMTGLDRAARTVHVAATFDGEGREITPKRTFAYDTLVIAIGSVGNDYGTPGVAQHAVMLDSPGDAERFYNRFLNACVRAYAQADAIRPDQLHVTIIGAGATGVELAAELHKTARYLVAFGLDTIDPETDIKISLIEASDRIVPALPERIGHVARGILTKLGVEVLTRTQVTEVTADGIKLAGGGYVASELVVWAAGVRGSEVLGKLDGLEISRSNQLVIRPTLQTTRDDNIFAIGDCSHFVPDGETRPIPPRAQAAHQQASHILGQMKRRLVDGPLRPFTYRDFGTLVSLGEATTIGNLMGLVPRRSAFIEGHVARLMYRSLHKAHLSALHGPVNVACDTLAHMLARRTEPRIKLH